MVGVAAKSHEDALSSVHNPMIKYMLKQRENHARAQKHDYSHVFRRKTRFELFRLSVIALSIELAYAAETSFVSPILLKIGVDHKLMTMAWGLSPLIGFFIAPLLGSVSDRCRCRWGRRRPIITMLSVGILLGLILVPHGQLFGELLGDTGYAATLIGGGASNFSSSDGSVAALVADDEGGANVANFKYAVILTIIGMVLLDLNADTCQTPARTYMLDMCTPEDQPRALTSFSLFAGVGGTIGYGIGGIDWEQTSIGEALGGNIPTVFGLVSIIFTLSYFVTITTFREIPLGLIERDPLLKPLSAGDIKKELNKHNTDIYYIKENTALETLDDEVERYKGGYQNSMPPGPPAIVAPLSSKALESGPLADDDDDNRPITLRQYLRSIVVMPRSMLILALTNLFCWMGHVTYCLYFTDFVGEAVFHGDPTAAPGSEAAELYEAGVRFGCMGMAVYAVSCSVYSVSVTKLMQWLGAKAVYIIGIMYYAISMLILGLWPTKWGVLFFSTSAGILYGTLFTMPYIILANYHAKNCFRVRNGETLPLKQKRGLGTDVAIVSSMVFIAQLVVSLSLGPLVYWMGTTSAVLYASSLLSVIAAVFAMFVLYI